MEYTCNDCNKKYYNYQSLWIHNKKYHNNKIYKTAPKTALKNKTALNVALKEY
jgi:hypothetical protein